jgi:hypothetical protein
VTVKVKTQHIPDRPLWLCEVDGMDWPCKDARRELLEEFRDDRAGLGVYLTGLLYWAAWDLDGTDDATAERLFTRFLRWSLLVLPIL